MGYHHISVDDIEPTPDRPSVQRSISDAADLENVAVNRYEVAPGEDIPLAYHYHDDQEELFYVLSGTLAVETPEGTYEVGEDEVFVVEPDSPQRAHNPESATDPVRALAIGAPAVDDAHPYEQE
ncbi:cupin domain-containing protein [Haloarcula brevis]|uniref:cupin domain-containing protein n=1 Tax=Haloarcula brevis TaxID=3111453 RepID=UPI00300F34CF